MKKFKMNTMAVVAVATMLSFAVAAPAYADSDKCAHNYNIIDSRKLVFLDCVKQVDLEDQRLKDGEVNANGDLVLYTEDQPAGQSRRAVTVDGFKTNVTDKIGANTVAIDAHGNAGNNAAQRNYNSIVGTLGFVQSHVNRGNIADNEGAIDDVNGRVDDTNQNVADNENMNNAQNKVLRRHNGEIGTNTTAISNVNNKVTNNENMNNAQNKVLRRHDGEIGTNSTNIGTNTTGISTNTTNIGTNTQGVADNENMNNAQNKVLRRHNGEIGANTTSITDLQDEIFNTNANSIADDNMMNQRIDNVMSDMRYMDRNLSAGIASAMAIGQHQFDPSYSGGQVSLAGGVFNGENAVSFAVGVPLGNQAFFSASIATDSGSYGESGSVGITYRLPK